MTASPEPARLFENDREALFVERPNRFLIIARDGDEDLRCHCPNPGRMAEFMFPGTRLILERRKDATLDRASSAGRASSPAKTGWTAAGLFYRDAVVPLFASRANRAAEALILPRLIPGLREIHREFSLGSSRFDFLCIGERGKRHLVEVKACSLVEHGTAMFPDAPSVRALKHLEELAALSREGYCAHVLFVIVHGKPGRFVPNMHTDPAFAAALSRLGEIAAPGADSSGQASAAGKVNVHAALINCDREGKAVLAAESVPVDLDHGILAESNGGNYLFILELREDYSITVGSLGVIGFKPGWYVDAGSARKNLSQRISRHLRKVRKQQHWHIDYLTPYAGKMQALPIMSYRNLECDLAKELERLGGEPTPGFGCSDCRCGSHLYRFNSPPMGNRDFADMLFRFRHAESLLR
jgi:sugar fermentation stimulation protein A